MRRILAIGGLVAALATTPALGHDHCFAPMEDWQPREAVVRLAEKNGWTVRRIRIDDGCYQIRGNDRDGHRIKVMVHPVTLEVMEVRLADEHDRDHRREHEHRHDDGPGRFGNGDGD